jgi:hypothetical protein
MDVGESWAYRARSQDPLVEVRVLRIGSNRPPRVLVRFVDDTFEGKEEWVPPARLKVLWAGVEEFRVREKRWEAVSADGPGRDAPEDYAASAVFDTLIPRDIATLGNNVRTGVSLIHDTQRLGDLLGLDPTEFESSPLACREDDALVAPWATTELIVRAAAQRNPDPILRQVDTEEAEYRHKTIHGEQYQSARDGQLRHLEAEWFVQRLDEPLNRPYWQLLRAWCGQDATDRHDEMVELRYEVARIGQLAEQAIALLREAGAAATPTGSLCC